MLCELFKGGGASIVGIATRLRQSNWRFDSRQEQEIFLSSNTRRMGPIHDPAQWVSGAEYVGDHWPNLVPRFGTDQYIHSPTYFHGVYRNNPTLFCEFLGFRNDAAEGSVLLGYDLEPSDAWWWNHYVVSNRRGTGNPVTRSHFTVERKHQSTLCWFAIAFIWRKCKRSFFRISSCHSQRHTPSSAEVVGSNALLLRGFISSQFRSASLSREPPERP